MVKRLLIINHYARPYSGRHFKMAEVLLKRGYQVHLLSANTSYVPLAHDFPKQTVLEKTYQNVPFTFIRARPYQTNGFDRMQNMGQFAFRAYKYARKRLPFTPEVIYASSVHPLSWVVGYLLAKKFNAKLIIETRDLWPETLIKMGRIQEKSPVARLLYRLERFMYERADHLIFTMPGGKKYLEERNISYQAVSHINNGVDVALFEHHAKTYTYPLKKERGSFHVIYTGSMGIANALDQLLLAAEWLHKEKRREIHFHLFGDGYLRQKLIQEAKDKGLTNMTFYGRVDKKYIPSILRQGDLNIVTSQPLPIYDYGVSLNKLFDYFASGKPTLSNVPTPYNKVETYGCGKTVAQEDPKALAEGILMMRDLDDQTYQTYCKNSLKAAKLYDFSTLATKLEHIIATFNQDN